ncbi:MAG: DUF2066 domain-containing protein [Immundisolibacter sp.]
MRLPSLLALCLLMLQPATAAQALDLYRARVPLTDAGQAAQQEAVVAAFGQVLAQVAGRGAPARLAAREAGKQAAARTVLGYGFSQDADGGMLLEARFDPAGVRRFLAEQGVATVPDSRPTLLLWLQLQQDGTKLWLGADEPPALAAAVDDAARTRGWPLLLPVLDLAERRQLPPNADPHTPATRAALNALAARYAPDGVLIGRLVGSDGRWRVVLYLNRPGTVDYTWSATGASAQAAMAAAFDQLGAHLAVAPPSGPPQAVEISIDGVHDLAAYGRVWNHLSQITAIQQLRPHVLDDRRVVFGFALPGGAAALASRVEPGAPFVRQTGTESSYRYRP